jgi:hypothetical protein
MYLTLQQGLLVPSWCQKIATGSGFLLETYLTVAFDLAYILELQFLLWRKTSYLQKCFLYQSLRRMIFQTLLAL